VPSVPFRNAIIALVDSSDEPASALLERIRAERAAEDKASPKPSRKGRIRK